MLYGGLQLLHSYWYLKALSNYPQYFINEHAMWTAGIQIRSRSRSQDVVDWSVAGTVWRTALGITSSWRESNHVPRSHCNSCIYRGQPVHNAGQTLQTGRAWSSVRCASWIHEERGNGLISDKQYVTQRNVKHDLSYNFVLQSYSCSQSLDSSEAIQDYYSQSKMKNIKKFHQHT